MLKFNKNFGMFGVDFKPEFSQVDFSTDLLDCVCVCMFVHACVCVSVCLCVFTNQYLG